MGRPIVDRPDEFPEFIYRGERTAEPMQTHVLGCQGTTEGVNIANHTGCALLPKEGPSLTGGPFNSPLERAAIALENLDSSDFHERQNKDYTEMARTVLMAIREPSETMIESGVDYRTVKPEARAKDCWQAMIDAALNQ